MTRIVADPTLRSRVGRSFDHGMRCHVNIEAGLNKFAERYRKLGYEVILRPTGTDLPVFASDFRVEIVARNGDGGVLTVVKQTPSELEADPLVEKYAEITQGQPGWKLDIFVLGPGTSTISEKLEPRELGDNDIRHAIGEAERMIQEGFANQALTAAWAVLEAAMRRCFAEVRGKVGPGTSTRTMLKELFSSGDIWS